MPGHFWIHLGHPKSEHSQTVLDLADATAFHPILFERSGPYITKIKDPNIFTQHPDSVYYFPPLPPKQDWTNIDMYHWSFIRYQLKMSVLHHKESPNVTKPYLHLKCPNINIRKHNHPYNIPTTAFSNPCQTCSYNGNAWNTLITIIKTPPYLELPEHAVTTSLPTLLATIITYTVETAASQYHFHWYITQVG